MNRKTASVPGGPLTPGLGFRLGSHGGFTKSNRIFLPGQTSWSALNPVTPLGVPLHGDGNFGMRIGTKPRRLSP